MAGLVAREVARRIEAVVGLHEHEEAAAENPDQHPMDTDAAQAGLDLRPHRAMILEVGFYDLRVILQI